LSSVIKFIHPDDLDYVIERHNGSFNRRNYQYYVSFYIIDGQTKYIKSVGSFTKNSDNELIKTGVVYDMTDGYTENFGVKEVILN
jgi:hypothetical protein